MIPRYTRPEMGRIRELENKYRKRSKENLERF